MRDTGIVTDFNSSGLVTIIPVIEGACLSCTVTGCAKRGKPFLVSNPKKLHLEIGKQVKVSESKKHQALQAIVNVFIPILLSIITYIFFNTQTNVSDGTKAGLTLLCLFLSCLILFFISTKRKLVQSEILEVVD